MKDKEQAAAAARFKKIWSDPARGGEKQDSQMFWTSLLTDVYGVKDLATFINYEEKVMLDHTSFIDGHIPSTKVLIEQKSRGKDLRQAIKQSDDNYLTPYQQAKRYSSELPLSEHPRWIVLSNFDEWHIYDMEKPQGDPEIVRLEDFDKDYYRLNFLVDNHQNEILQKEMEISVKAGEIVGKLYDALLKEYKNPKDPETLKSLNELVVRLVFCFYAEDSGIFDTHLQFHDFMKDRRNPRGALIELFNVLDTPYDERDPYLDEEILAFPYVNGGLFANHGTEIPRLNDEIMEIIIHEASEDFDWSSISPTIFGAVFESTLNPETRRSGGMHYTSLENIHHVIDPLFLNDLQNEFDEIKDTVNKSSRTKKLKSFQTKIASLKFLDPACGSGNFLTETYLSLRKLENEVLKLLLGDQIRIGFGEEYDPIQVNLAQFYGIEINDFAVSVARTALWIAEHQMMKKTEEILHSDLDFLPLKTYTNIHEGNALRMDWNEVVPAYEVNYVYGNPPFCGRRYRTLEQTKDVATFFSYKDIDYVACWYKKAAEFIQNTDTSCAFVSTNSITQGEQVPALWDELFNLNIEIDFARKTFKWESEAKKKAAVYCVIIGFSIKKKNKTKFLYSSNNAVKVKNINGYLIDGPNVSVKPSKKTLCQHIPKMMNGNVPLDGDALKIEPEDLHEFKSCKKYVKRLIGGRELLHNTKRYVLWLVDVSPSEMKKYPVIRKRVEMCRENRLNAKDKSTQKLALSPTTFRDTNNPKNYIALPMVSSENRRYIPMAYFHEDTVPTNQVQTIPGATIYHFGVLESNVHMAWMRAVTGRLEMRYRYSKDIVYNNFPWPTPTKEQKLTIEKTAQGILDARNLYPESSLSDLYDDLLMPAELRRAHQENDAAVMQAYGFKATGEGKMTEADCVAALMQMYQDLISGKAKE